MKQIITFILLSFSFHLFSQPPRSAHGTPGPAYWQNRADYSISVKLDTATHRLSGTVEITYTNNSPFDLSYLWLQLDQNKFKADSRGSLALSAGDRHEGSITNGFEISRVRIDGKESGYFVTETRMQLRLLTPLKAQNGVLNIAIDYAFTIPETGGDRMGRILLEDGWVYEVAQWYPRMAVIDDLNGWNNLPYLGTGEFYCEYGDFEYEITLPAGFVVAGSGSLQNPGDVLTSRMRANLKKAAKSEETVYIISPEEAAGAFPNSDEQVTWKFAMNNSRDVAWACARGFIWDAAKANLPGGKTTLIQSFYPKESMEGWSRATEYAKTSIEHYSAQWFTYPYPSLSSVAGTVGGMEYPGIHFTEYDRGGNGLWVTVDHEVAHNWFPMIVGSNERQHAWMDESLVTFMGVYAAQAYEGADYSSYISNHRFMMQRFMDADLQAVATPPRKIGPGFSDVVYFKPAIALFLLREYILGHDRFDFAFRTYIREWAYKHPAPEDFFQCMENAAGEELDWFWESWFYSTEDLDQAIREARRFDSGAVSIEIENRLGMPMPVVLEFEFENGTTQRIQLPVDIWNKGNTHRMMYDEGLPVKAVRIDPDGWLPDVEPRNNIWEF